jgi:hypothetical protein
LTDSPCSYAQPTPDAFGASAFQYRIYNSLQVRLAFPFAGVLASSSPASLCFASLDRLG